MPYFFRPLFVSYTGPQPFVRLSYLHLTLDNSASINSLANIAVLNNDDRLLVQVHSPLPGALVLALLDQTEVEKLRAALNAFVPAGPHGRGWNDPVSGAWRLAELTQELLPGPISLLPSTPPADAPFPRYATEVFVHHLHDYVQCNEAVVAAARAAITARPHDPALLEQLNTLWGPSNQQRQQQQRRTDEAAAPLSTNMDERSTKAGGAKTLLDFVNVTYPQPHVSTSTSSAPSNRLSTIFSCFDGGSPVLTYVPTTRHSVGCEPSQRLGRRRAL